MATKPTPAKKTAAKKTAAKKTAAKKAEPAKKPTAAKPPKKDDSTVYVNAHLTDSDQIDAAIAKHPGAKEIHHWGNPINVKEYKDGQNASE